MKEYKTTESIVAFIDILGSSHAIEKDSEGTLNIIHKVYDDSISQFQRVFANHNIRPQIRIYSDNITIYHPCPDEIIKQVFYNIAIMCAVIQEKMIANGFLVRGGITKGDFYCDNVLIWGRALVHAYDLESNIAIYPRIIVDPELVANLELFTKPDDPINKNQSKWIFQDYDGLVYIDYLHDFTCLNNPFCINIFLDDIEQKIGSSQNLKVTQKYLWQRSYLLRKHKELFSEEHFQKALSMIAENNDDGKETLNTETGVDEKNE